MESHESVLICTLFRDSEFYLDTFLECLQELGEYSLGAYNIDLCFIEGDSIDNTYQKLNTWLGKYKYKSALHKKDIDQTISRYHRLDILRNTALKKGLKPHHDYVLMIDSDLSFREDLLQCLVQSIEQTDGSIIAPMTHVENTEFFHDTLAFVKDGVRFQNLYPYHEALKKNNGNIVQMDSVGDCFLIKAGDIRDVKFQGMGAWGYGMSEQIGFCKNIRKKGGKIYMDPNIMVYHADLPAYGLKWH